MVIARSKEGPCAPLFYGALALLLGGLANAQTVEVSALERCAALAAQADKLACFEALIDDARPQAVAAAEPPTADAAVDVAVAAEPEVAPEPVVFESVAPVESSSAQVVAGAAAATIPAAAPAESESSAMASVAGPAPAEKSPVIESASASASRDDEFGRDHLRTSQPEEPNILNATVISVNKDRYGALIFELDNGQIWRQMEPRYYPYPRNEEFDVEISTGMMGEYRLQVGGSGRKVRIKRTR